MRRRKLTQKHQEEADKTLKAKAQEAKNAARPNGKRGKWEVARASESAYNTAPGLAREIDRIVRGLRRR
jgi:hypothetical protein